MALNDPNAWQAWLKFSSQFHRYSFGNSLLIMLQDPRATHVAGYQAFKAMGRQVRRGETGIKVLAPITRREPRLDDAWPNWCVTTRAASCTGHTSSARNPSRCSTSGRPMGLRCPTPRSMRRPSSRGKPPSDCGIACKASSRHGDSTYVGARTSAGQTATRTSASGSSRSATTLTTPRPSRPSLTKPDTCFFTKTRAAATAAGSWKWRPNRSRTW
ncbi:ArdC family protein [Propioniciclava flava]